MVERTPEYSLLMRAQRRDLSRALAVLFHSGESDSFQSMRISEAMFLSDSDYIFSSWGDSNSPLNRLRT